MFVSQTPIGSSPERRCPDIEAAPGAYDIISFDVEPGDVIVHHVLTVHGAGGNTSDTWRRAMSFRYCGDRVRYLDRPEPFPRSACLTVFRMATGYSARIIHLSGQSRGQDLGLLRRLTRRDRAMPGPDSARAMRKLALSAGILVRLAEILNVPLILLFDRGQAVEKRAKSPTDLTRALCHRLIDRTTSQRKLSAMAQVLKAMQDSP